MLLEMLLERSMMEYKVVHKIYVEQARSLVTRQAGWPAGPRAIAILAAGIHVESILSAPTKRKKLGDGKCFERRKACLFLFF